MLHMLNYDEALDGPMTGTGQYAAKHLSPSKDEPNSFLRFGIGYIAMSGEFEPLIGLMSEELNEKEFHARKTGIYPFQRDAWDGWVLHDFTAPPQPIRQYAIGAADEEIRELTESNFVYGDKIQLSANPLLIRRNDQFILVDTGMGKQMDGESGRLLHHLSQLGIERDQITSILLTHLHIDHIGGSFSGKDPLFPNAKVFISEPQPPEAFVEALSRLLARWMLTRSQAPEMETLTTLCKTHAYVLNPEKIL
jgi:hypothetical protein